MRIVLVAGDFAESKILSQLKYVLSNDNHEVESFLGEGKPFCGEEIENIRKRVEKSDLVILGTSNTPTAEAVIAAGEEAIKSGVRFGFCAPGNSFYKLEFFKGCYAQSSFLFVLNEEEDIARKLFPRADIVAMGNPLLEEMFECPLSREEVREKLNIGEEETLILCPGDKVFAVNFLLFGNVISAVHDDALKSYKPHVVIGLHPGDLNDQTLYRELKTYSNIPVQILTRDIMKSAQVIAGADLVVNSVSAIGIQAAMQKKPVISFLTTAAQIDLDKTFGPDYEWPPGKVGVIEKITVSIDELAKAISRLLTKEGYAPLLKRQREVYPSIPTPGTAIQRMTHYINTLQLH